MGIFFVETPCIIVFYCFESDIQYNLFINLHLLTNPCMQESHITMIAPSWNVHLLYHLDCNCKFPRSLSSPQYTFILRFTMTINPSTLYSRFVITCKLQNLEIKGYVILFKSPSRDIRRNSRTTIWPHNSPPARLLRCRVINILVVWSQKHKT